MICERTLSSEAKIFTLTQKGCEGIQRASLERSCDINVTIGQVVHIKCRRDFTNSKLIQSQKKRKLIEETADKSKPVLRSDSIFTYSRDCIFCACPDASNGRISDHKLIPVRTLDFTDTILKACDEFPSEWTDTVRGRVLYVQDLPAADAVYHKVCSGNFRTGKQIPKVFHLNTFLKTSKS